MKKIKKAIAEIGKRLYDKGYAAGTSGNISIRHENNILITPSGQCLGELSHDDIVTIDLHGNNISKSKKASSEKMMHVEIYKVRPDICTIIHAHPPKSTAFAVAGIPLNKAILAEAVVFLGTIPVAEYATPSSDILAGNVAKYFLNHDAVLMANHGAVLGGRDLKDTYYKFETMELYAEIYLWSKLLGNSVELSESDLLELNKIREMVLNK